MTQPIAFDDAVDLLDLDHKAVKQMFIDHGALCDLRSPPGATWDLAQRICKALTVHAQLEEEIFYPQVRAAVGDDALMDTALSEHAQAKQLITRIQAMASSDPACEAIVKQLGLVIDGHVMEEREQIFLKARYAALDLRGMVAPLLKRQQQLKKASSLPTPKKATP